ncbi:MAG: hypothetical protein V4681_01555 [Patescibacteria group bacterium]
MTQGTFDDRFQALMHQRRQTSLEEQQLRGVEEVGFRVAISMDESEEGRQELRLGENTLIAWFRSGCKNKGGAECTAMGVELIRPPELTHEQYAVAKTWLAGLIEAHVCQHLL